MCQHYRSRDDTKAQRLDRLRSGRYIQLWVALGKQHALSSKTLKALSSIFSWREHHQRCPWPSSSCLRPQLALSSSFSGASVEAGSWTMRQRSRLAEAGKATEMGSTMRGSGAAACSFVEDLEPLVFNFFLEGASSYVSLCFLFLASALACLVFDTSPTYL